MFCTLCGRCSLPVPVLRVTSWVDVIRLFIPAFSFGEAAAATLCSAAARPRMSKSVAGFRSSAVSPSSVRLTTILAWNRSRWFRLDLSAR